MGSPERTATRLAVQRIQPAYRQVADQIRVRIITGQLPPGSRLPNENALSEMFGVSRSTIREALRVLSSHSLVRTTRGVSGGTRVTRPDPDQIAEYLETSIGLLSGSDDVTVAELTEFRSLLEVPAAGLAAERRTDRDLEILRATLSTESESLDEDDVYAGHRIFHQQILAATRNALLEMVTAPMVNTLRTRVLREQAPARFWEIAAEEHARIYTHIERGDAEGARQEMRLHLETLAETQGRIGGTPGALTDLADQFPATSD